MTDRRYWLAVRRPVACLTFVLPLLVGYEAALLVYPQQHWPAFRNGAEQFARMLFAAVGLRHPAALPATIVLSLLMWQWAGRYRWRITGMMLAGMLAESLLYSVLLMLLAHVQGRLLSETLGASTSRRMAAPAIRPTALRPAAPQRARGPSPGRGPAGPSALVCPRMSTGDSPSADIADIRPDAGSRILASVGAGMYEETVFRLWLLPLVVAVCNRCGVRRSFSWTTAALVSSVVFALAHHLPGGEPLRLQALLFRTTAGLLFALLFVTRGFGITVGTHAAYDVLILTAA